MTFISIPFLRQLHVTNGPKPPGGEGVPPGDVPRHSRGFAPHEGSWFVRTSGQNEDVQASSE